MGNPIKAGLALICVIFCVYMSVGMLWAELGMPSDMGKSKDNPFPHTIKLLQLEGVFTPLVDHYNGSFKDDTEKHLKEKKADGPLGDYVYSFAIGLAFLFGAVAIIAAGSDDEVEKSLVNENK